jgi:hypothetical protein
MRSIVITERTREEKAKIEENRLVVTAANMMLLESNVRFLLLRWLALALAYCYRNDHPTTERERCMPNKRKNEHRTGFRDVFLVALPLSLSLSRLPSFSPACCSYPQRQRRQIIWIHVFVRSEFWLSGWIERQFDREKSWLEFILFFFIFFYLFLNCDIGIIK